MMSERLQTAVLSLALVAGVAGCASAPEPKPDPPVTVEPTVLPELECPGAVAKNPGRAYQEGLGLVESSKSGKYRGGLSYQAGMERLLAAARAGHSDAQYLYGWRLLIDAYESRAPVEGDAAQRQLYGRALSFMALAARDGQVHAVAFFPAPVLRSILAPLVSYTPVSELEGTPFEHIPAAWVEQARLQVVESGTCVTRKAPRAVVSAPLPKAPKGFIAVPGGREFMAGEVNFDREPSPLSTRDAQRHITLTRSFFAQATEVTRAQWRARMGRMPRGMPPCQGELCPVSGVSWLEAVRYVNSLSASEGLEACYTLKGKAVTFVGLDCLGYRLPTDAEWEYLSRAGQGGNRYGLVADIARASTSTGTTPGPQPVAGLAANPWGFFDTLGNVEEWCHDLHEQLKPGSIEDPIGPRFGLHRVVRGGSYGSGIEGIGFATRRRLEEDKRDPRVGLRPVRTLHTAQTIEP